MQLYPETLRMPVHHREECRRVVINKCKHQCIQYMGRIGAPVEFSLLLIEVTPGDVQVFINVRKPVYTMKDLPGLLRVMA